MLFFNLLFLLALRGGNADRAADPLIEVDFLKPACVVDNKFPATAGLLNDFEFVSMDFEPTFTCPVIKFNNFTFTDASNGFKPLSDASIISNNVVPPEPFGNDKLEHSFEFFLFVGDFQDTEPFTLFELGRNGFGDIFNTWVSNVDFLLRIGFSKDGGVFEFLGEFGEENFVAPVNVPDDVGEFIHLVITIVRPNPPNSGIVDLNVFLNGVDLVTDSQNIENTGFLFDNIADEVFFTLGMSFNSLRENSGEVTMPYDMHKFAIYDRPLSDAEINENFLASVANSLPTGRNIDIPHLEDIPTSFTFENIVATFDFDRDILNKTDELIEFIIETTVNSEVGTLRDGNGDEVAENQPLPLVTGLEFRQTVLNEDDEVATIDYFLIQNRNQEQRSLEINRISLNFVEQNDPPVALDNQVEIAESQNNPVRLLANDPLDVGDGKNTDFFPQKVIIQSVDDIDTALVDGVFEPVGEFVDCTTNDPIEVNNEFPLVQDGDEFFAEICFQSGEFDVSEDAVIGSAKIEFLVVDQENSLNIGTTTVDVLQALFAGCQFLDPTKCEEIVFEADVTNDNEIVIELQFFDSRCDQAEINGQQLPPVNANDTACIERFEAREAIIVGPLPDPVTEGEFIYVSNGEDVVLDVEDLGEDNQFTLPEGNRREDGVFEIKFRAASRYFNLSPFPFCNRNEGNRAGIDDVLFPERSDCVDFTFTDELRCLGDFCNEPLGQVEGFSTALFIDESFIHYGACGEAEPFRDGCPIRLFTRLQIGTGLSPLEENSDPTQIIWVKNSIEDIENQDRNIVVEEREIAVEELIGQAIDPPVELIDGEPNARIIMVIIDINQGGAVQIGQIGDFQNASAEGNLAFLDADPGFGNGIGDLGTFSPADVQGQIIGPSPRINEFLKGLFVTPEEGSRLRLQIQDPYRKDSAAGIKSADFDFVLGDGEEENTRFIDIFLNPYVLGSLGLCCFISCFCCWRCFKNDTCGCVWLGGRAKLTVKKAVYSDKRMKGSIEDEDAEANSKKDDSSRRNRGKAKQAIPRSHRKTDPSKVKSRRAHIPKDSHRKKKGPVQSHRKDPPGSKRSRGSSSDSGSSRNNPSKERVYKKRLPPKSHRNDG